MVTQKMLNTCCGPSKAQARKPNLKHQVPKDEPTGQEIEENQAQQLANRHISKNTRQPRI
jgi:hypothetical protein